MELFRNSGTPVCIYRKDRDCDLTGHVRGGGILIAGISSASAVFQHLHK
jgi:hypothetical protein